MTSFALPSILTLANKIIDQVNAPTTILTWIWVTVVVIYVTELSTPTVWTKTPKRVNFIGTSATVLAGIPKTVIYVLMAIGPSEASVARTGEIPSRQTNAASVRPADIGRDVTDTFLGGISRNRYCTAVYDFA